MSHTGAVFCEIRYKLDPNRLSEFQEYGRAWINLIERHGGVHHGFFMPRPAPSDTAISFPEKGRCGAEGIAIALYGFPDEGTYNNFRKQISRDPEAAPIIERFAEPPFQSYERTFLSPLPPRE
jgi:NIPSNAP